MPASRLDEFIALFREKRTWSVADIRNRLGVSRQTVYRYRDQLYSKKDISLEAHIRDDDNTLLKVEDLAEGSFRWPESAAFEDDVSLSLSKAEVEALKTAVAQTEHLTPLLKSALANLGKSSEVKKQLKADPIIYNPQVDRYDQKLFEKVSKAILDRRIALLTYENAKGQKKTYKFNAYKIISSDNHLHLVGVSHNSIQAGYNTVIRLRLDRVTDFAFFFEKGKGMYFGKPNFKVKDYAHREFGPFSADGEPQLIRILFSQEKSGYIERTKRHPSQDVTIQDDRTAIWQITAPLTEDLVYWIVSYGPHATVLEPPELKEQVLEWARGSLDANS